jgi:hypothetical protein
VPTADSELAVGDRITVVVSPEAAGALKLLRDGASVNG